MTDYSQYSFWLDTAGEPLTPRPAAQRSAEFDIVIVGAGFTGLWSAYYLSEHDPSLKIAIVEKEIAGYGASGRNGGWCSSRFPVSPSMLQKRFGTQSARALVLAMYGAVDEIGRVCETHAIDAQFHKGGILSVARGLHQLPAIQQAHKTYRKLGFADRYRLLDATQVAERVKISKAEGGLFTQHGASVHPARLARGLARVLENRGVTIYEGTPVLSFRSPQVLVPGGSLTARKALLLATEAYSAAIPGLRRTVLPMYSLITLTEPLSDEQLSAVGWRDRESLASTRNTVEYLTLTADRRILFGGRGAPYAFGSKITDEQDHHAATHARLQRALLEWFPALNGIRFTHCWGGPVGMPRDWMPSVHFDAAAKLAFARGYTGQGVTTANLTARALAGLITGKSTELESLPFVRHRSPKWEIEPFRWMEVRYMQSAFLRLDAALESGNPKPIDAALVEFLGRH